MAIKTKAFGVAQTKGKKTKAKTPAKSLPVKRTWDTTSLKTARVSTYSRQISASILDDDKAMAKAFHLAVLEWRERSGEEHPGRVYLETVPTGEIVPGPDGESTLNVTVKIVVESAPENSAR